MVATIITCAGTEFLAACADTALTDASATAIAKRLREPYCVGRATAFPESRSVAKAAVMLICGNPRHSYNLGGAIGETAAAQPVPGVHGLHI
jgi:hypothetical protein